MKRNLIRILACILVMGLLVPSAMALTVVWDDPHMIDGDGNAITEKTITLGVGEYIRLGYEIYYFADTDTTLTSTNLTYTQSSSNPEVAIFDEYGYVHALSVGSAVVTIESYDLLQDETGATAKGGGKVSCTVIVKEVEYKNPFEKIDPDKVSNPFSDISKKDWYYDYVMYLYAAGMYEGVDFGNGTAFSASSLAAASRDSTYQLSKLSNHTAAFSSSSNARVSLLTNKSNAFQANSKENRANTVTVMYNGHKSSGGTIGSYTKNPFTDVASSKAYYQPVLWAAATGSVNGYGNGLFGPADGITREQFCAILVRYACRYGFELPSNIAAKTFSDSGSISSWAKDAVSACQKAGIINGYSDGSFRPQAGISRAEVSAMIYRFLNTILDNGNDA